MVVNKILKKQEAFIEGKQEAKKESQPQKFRQLHNVLDSVNTSLNLC